MDRLQEALLVRIVKLFSILISLLLFVTSLYGADIYVSTTGNDDTGDGSIETPYATVQHGIDQCSVGDTIYLRGGTYNEGNIDIPESKNGTSWSAGSFTTLTSYPGEWAKIDSTGLGTENDMFHQASIGHMSSYGCTTVGNTTDYWKFERFEVTGGRDGFFFKGDHLWFTRLYIHDVGRNAGDKILAGIHLSIPRDCVIEYCYISNVVHPSSTGNDGAIVLHADQRDSLEGCGGAFVEATAIKNNIIRYNYISGGVQGIRHKNQQRFGDNCRNPNDMTYKDWGDKIHHNLFLGQSASQSISVCQDFTQVYNNITDRTIGQRDGDRPIVYNQCIYNNTVTSSGASFQASAGLTQYGDSGLGNYYDDGDQQTVHPHIWYYNNISHGCGEAYHTMPFYLFWDMPANSTNPDWDMSDVVIENNFIHESAYSSNVTFNIGHNYAFSGCDKQEYTTSEYNSCAASWRGIDSVINWENDNSGLFQGSSGSSQFKTSGSFVVGGSVTITNGGKGGDHPYLSGVTIPSYVGAVNPSDSDWVAGVISLATTSGFVTAENGSTPSWVEGTEAPTSSPVSNSGCAPIGCGSTGGG